MGDDLLKRLAGLDSCAVSDALDKAGVAGVVTGLVELSACRRITGRAVTVKLGLPAGDPAARHLGTSAIEASGPGTIIVVAHDGRTDVAGWGGILTLAASLRGIEGVIIDGACRDIDEARALDFPVYGRCGTPRTARGRVVERAWNEEVVLAGVAVAPGDFVIADGSGVVVIPEGRAADLIRSAEEIAGREAAMVDAVRAGAAVSQVMGGQYEAMLGQSPR